MEALSDRERSLLVENNVTYPDRRELILNVSQVGASAYSGLFPTVTPKGLFYFSEQMRLARPASHTDATSEPSLLAY